MKQVILIMVFCAVFVGTAVAELTPKQFEELKKKTENLSPVQKNELHSFLQQNMIQVTGVEDCPSLERKVYVILGSFTSKIDKVIFTRGFTAGIANPILKVEVKLKDGTSGYEWKEVEQKYANIEKVGVNLLLQLAQKIFKAEKLK